MGIALFYAHHISFAKRTQKFENMTEMCTKPTQSQVPKVVEGKIQVHHKQTSIVSLEEDDSKQDVVKYPLSGGGSI